MERNHAERRHVDRSVAGCNIIGKVGTGRALGKVIEHVRRNCGCVGLRGVGGGRSARQKQMNEPIDHHYVPVFYLSRWAGSDGCLCRFSRPYGNEAKPKRVVPKGTAFEPRLYETRGLPPEQAQTMEKDFMAKLDSDAAGFGWMVVMTIAGGLAVVTST
jgi:hypothetical protein